jgi:hypothetical protein
MRVHYEPKEPIPFTVLWAAFQADRKLWILNGVYLQTYPMPTYHRGLVGTEPCVSKVTGSSTSQKKQEKVHKRRKAQFQLL